MKNFIINICKKILCYYGEHYPVTKTIVTTTQKSGKPYLRHNYRCTNCDVSLGMECEEI